MRGDFSRLLIELARQYQGVYEQQGRVDLDSDTNAAAFLEQNLRRLIVRDLLGPAGAPDGSAGFEISVGTTDGGTPDDTLLISAGRYWVNGFLCRNSGLRSLTEQPYLPGYELPTDDGSYDLYLEVWERAVNGFQDPRLLDPALGGVDTTVRSQAVWQVRAGLQSGSGGSSPRPPGVVTSSGLLQARCLQGNVPGNRLYRVQIHYPQLPDPGGSAPTPPAPSFKWSRDNASAVLAINTWSSSGTGAGLLVTAKVRTFGSPLDTVVQPLDWVELTDDAIELTPEALPLWQVQEVRPETSTVTLVPSDPAAPEPVVLPRLRPMLLRWDQQLTEAGQLENGTEVIRFDEWMDLEDGIQVLFQASAPSGGAGGGAVTPLVYQTGDAWMFDSRTAIADIQWPQTSNGEPRKLPKNEPYRSYAPLASASLSGGAWGSVTDARTVYTPLAGSSNSSSAEGDEVGADGDVAEGIEVSDRFRRLEERVRQLEARDEATGTASEEAGGTAKESASAGRSGKAGSGKGRPRKSKKT